MAQNTSLVTGATRGMGLAIATRLARAGHRVVLVARNPEGGRAAQHQVQRVSGNGDVEWLRADLTDQHQIRSLAASVLERHERLDVLVNNAGAHVRHRALSADGLELNLAVNHLAGFLLTQLLLPALHASPAPPGCHGGVQRHDPAARPGLHAPGPRF